MNDINNVQEKETDRRIRVLYDGDRLLVTLHRLAHQIVENHPSTDRLYIIGIQPRGIILAYRMQSILNGLFQTTIPVGEIDGTFARDDFRKKSIPLLPGRTQLNEPIENRSILLIDDVLYTGRTVRAVLSEIAKYGRPANVELLSLIDRKRKREYPVEANYIGFAVETLDSEKVFVEWIETHGTDTARIESIHQE